MFGSEIPNYSLLVSLRLFGVEAGKCSLTAPSPRRVPTMRGPSRASPRNVWPLKSARRSRAARRPSDIPPRDDRESELRSAAAPERP
eukprot:6733822-Alexandrium_andersonii.AAC.1